MQKNSNDLVQTMKIQNDLGTFANGCTARYPNFNKIAHNKQSRQVSYKSKKNE